MELPIELIKETIPDQKAANELLQRLFSVAQPGAVFGDPVTNGEYTAITASEVSVGLGVGYGGGGGGSPQTEDGEQAGMGVGTGGGGGGGAAARPVAVIEIGPHGVRVEPVVDPTKIALAFFTAFGSMALMLSRMRRQASG